MAVGRTEGANVESSAAWRLPFSSSPHSINAQALRAGSRSARR
jgi:hypothetical protein